jgi:hypothetical protein
MDMGSCQWLLDPTYHQICSTQASRNLHGHLEIAWIIKKIETAIENWLAAELLYMSSEPKTTLSL